MGFAARPGLRLGQPPSPLLRHRTPFPVGTLHHLTISSPPGLQSTNAPPLQNLRAQMAPAKRHPKRHRNNTFSSSGAGYAPCPQNPVRLSVADPRRSRATIPSVFCRLSAAPRPFRPGESAPRDGWPVRVQIWILLVAPAGPAETAEPSVSGGTRTPARRRRGHGQAARIACRASPWWASGWLAADVVGPWCGMHTPAARMRAKSE